MGLASNSLAVFFQYFYHRTSDLYIKLRVGVFFKLLDDEKAEALKKTRFDGQIHFAWDLMGSEEQIINGLKLLQRYKIRGSVYVLIGFNTAFEEDIYRCQIIHNYGCDPYPMPFIINSYTSKFRRMINLRMYRKYKTIQEAWNNYKA